MPFRNDIEVMILVTRFQDFDHGKEIQQSIPESRNLQAGDRLPWICAQFDGIAEVVDREENGTGRLCTFRKIS